MANTKKRGGFPSSGKIRSVDDLIEAIGSYVYSGSVSYEHIASELSDQSNLDYELSEGLWYEFKGMDELINHCQNKTGLFSPYNIYPTLFSVSRKLAECAMDCTWLTDGSPEAAEATRIFAAEAQRAGALPFNAMHPDAASTGLISVVENEIKLNRSITNPRAVTHFNPFPDMFVRMDVLDHKVKTVLERHYLAAKRDISSIHFTFLKNELGEIGYKFDVQADTGIENLRPEVITSHDALALLDQYTNTLAPGVRDAIGHDPSVTYSIETLKAEIAGKESINYDELKAQAEGFIYAVSHACIASVYRGELPRSVLLGCSYAPAPAPAPAPVLQAPDRGPEPEYSSPSL